MDKKIILFLVEGYSDQHSFEHILDEVSNNKVKYKIIGGDITSKSGPYNVVKKIKQKVEEFIGDPKNKYLLSDIKKIVHLVDIDGVFLSDDLIVEDKKIAHVSFIDGKCYAKDRSKLIQRNENKRLVIKKLVYTKNIKFGDIKIPYEIYYFSCNLEHVFHDDPNVFTQQEKENLSNKLADQYFGYGALFVQYLKEADYSTTNQYLESWQEIMKETRQVKKLTNFNLFFD